ncbi:NACHT domain-containing protein [Paenibacillus sp. EC2-1]|uniref:NACHT domain-containing protein n=1 Tax=Paenibacillus sp. EC2-1 TaxID=3388665 RepID=UPI003BEF1553
MTEKGYLVDPKSEYGKFINLNIKTTEDISNFTCVVLLGEPGIGKSESMKSLVSAEDNEDKFLHINLRSYGSEERLIRSLFENPIFLEWEKSNEDNIYIYLDSLDECLLRINHVSSILADEFKKFDVQRIYLRIACRTSEWPHQLEKDLVELWGKDQFSALELLPLREKDVIEVVKDKGLHVNNFITELSEKDIVPFAIKPVTLQMLIDIYQSSGRFPETQGEIYLQGCQILCEEPNETRKKFAHVDPRRRLTIASRIAALTVFTNKYAIGYNRSIRIAAEEDIHISDIIDGSNRTLEDVLVLNESDVLEVLSTGLFTSRGINRLGWAHQTYAEYLSALYIVENKLELEQIVSLIRHPEDGHIVPQLYEVASWLASFNIDIFKYICVHDPEVLLRSDIKGADVKAKSELVTTLLDRYDSGLMHDGNYEINRNFYKLRHNDLASQLEPYIMDNSKDLIVRRVAIRIAKACNITEVKKYLLDLTFNKKEEYYLRVEAGKAFIGMSDDKGILELFPLIRFDHEDDPDEELKGIILKALWPNYISAQELFSCLNLPKRSNLIGLYRHFISHDIIESLSDEDLPFALNWVEQFIDVHNIKLIIEDLFHAIMQRAIELISIPSIFVPFIRVLKKRIKNFDRFAYLSRLHNDEILKKTIITGLIDEVETPSDMRHISYAAFLQPSDLPWLLEKITIIKEVESQREYARVINRVFNPSDYEHVDLLMAAAQENEVLTQELRYYFDSVQINSENGKKLKENHYFLEGIREKNNQAERVEIPSLTQRINKYLTQIELGNVEAWERLCYELSFDKDGNGSSLLEPNFMNYSSWLQLDVNDRKRTIDCSEIYIKFIKLKRDQWFGEKFNKSFIAAYKALRLIYDYNYKVILELSNDDWARWSPVLLTQYTDSQQEKLIQTHLIKLAYSRNSDQIISDLLTLMREENKSHNNIFVNELISDCWDEKMKLIMFQFYKSNDLAPQSKKTLLKDLLINKVNGIEKYVLTEIKSELTAGNTENRQKIILEAVALCNYSIQGWKRIWNFRTTQTEFLKEVFLAVADEGQSLLKLNSIKDSLLADFYLWLVNHFPYEEDPKYEDDEMAHFVAPRESLAELRDNILRLLKMRGTKESQFEYQRVVHELPQLSWLKWGLAEVNLAVRRNTWTPPRPIDIILLTSNKEKRLVRSGEELLDVIVNALKRIEKRFHGVTPEVRSLWNDLGDNKFTPWSENDFSNYIKQRLDDEIRGRGIITNREVELQPTLGSEKGERTDIHVDAILPENHNYEKITVIIEVKGNWNPELLGAMQDQLSNRYLKEGKTLYGLYLVAWFDSDKWDPNDPRKRKSLKHDISEMKKVLQEQAERLSTNKMIKQYVMNVTY